MTTKKQRRAAVAEKRARYDEATRLLGLAAQERARQQREQRAFELERIESSKKRAIAARKIADACKAQDEKTVEEYTPASVRFDRAWQSPEGIDVTRKAADNS